MAMKTQTIATTKRFLSASSTGRSIIEEHSAFRDDAFPSFQAAPDDGIVVLLKADINTARLEAPRRDLDEHLARLVLQDERGRRHDRHRELRGEESDVSKHARLQPGVGIGKTDADFGPAGIRIENIAHEQNVALEQFARIG